MTVKHIKKHNLVSITEANKIKMSHLQIQHQQIISLGCFLVHTVVKHGVRVILRVWPENYYFYNIFLQKSCRFSLQTHTKFEAVKTGSGVGF